MKPKPLYNELKKVMFQNAQNAQRLKSQKSITTNNIFCCFAVHCTFFTPKAVFFQSIKKCGFTLCGKVFCSAPFAIFFECCTCRYICVIRCQTIINKLQDFIKIVFIFLCSSFHTIRRTFSQLLKIIQTMVDKGAITRNSIDGDQEICDRVLDALGK